MTIQPAAVSSAGSNINVNFKRTTNQAEKIKEKHNTSNDDGNKIFAALSALAVLSVAGLGIAAGFRKGKTDVHGTVKGVQSATGNISRTNIKTSSVSETFASGQKDISEALQQKGRQNVQNINSASTKKDFSNNINRGAKRGSGNDIASFRTKQTEARSNISKKNIAVQQTLKDTNKSIASSEGNIKNAGQGIKSAADTQFLDKKAQTAQNAATDILNNAQKMKNIAEEVPTHKNTIKARAAENKAIRAQLAAERVQSQIDKKKAQIISDTIKKEQNIQRMINNTPPERLLEGQKKMEQNAQKTSARAIQRKADKTINKPGYQRALRKFQNYSKEKLQGVITSTKTASVEKTVAQDLLNAMDKI